MNSSDPLYPFRLALSYLEKVEGDLSKWEAVREARRSDVTTFDHVRAKYRAHRKKAREVVEDLRAHATEEIGLLEEELHVQGRARKKLIEAASAGGVVPEKVNEQNRDLVRIIGDLEERLATAHAIVAAETTEDVGGFETLPIEEYEKKLIPPKPFEANKPAWSITPGISAAVVAVLILLGIAGYVFVSSGGTARASFKAGRLASDPALIRVSCKNEGSRTVQVYVPWPEGNTRPSGASRSSYGILLYVVERDGNSLKLVENSEGCWRYRGVYLDGPGPISVRPGGAGDVLLDTNKLKEIGVDAALVRLVFTRSGGTEVGRFEAAIE